MERLNKLLSLTPFSKEETDLFVSKLIPKQLNALEFLHQANEVCKYEAFLEKGIMRSFYKINEDEIINQFFFEGQWVADYESFISQTSSKVNIQALEGCQLYLMTKEDIDDLSTQISNWDKLAKLFFEKLYLKKEKRNASLLLESAEERYLNLVKHQPQLINRVPQFYIAQYIGIKPESLSRIRKKMSQRNFGRS